MRRDAARAQGRRQQMDAHALAQRADRVQRPRRGFAQHGERVAEQDELVQPRRYGVEHHVALVAVGEVQPLGSCLVFGLDGRGAMLANVAPTARDCRRCAVQQQVRDAAHRGSHDGDLVPFAVQRADDVGRLRHCRGAADRRAAELDNESLSHS